MSYYEPQEEKTTEKSLFIGLDLGQAQDYTALGIIDCTRHTVSSEITRLDCVHLQRWALRTPYPTIVSDVVKMINSLKPFQSPDYTPVLAVDATGVGAPVVDLFRRETFNATLRPIQIIGGSTVTKEGDLTRVPKRELVSVVQVGLQNRTLKIAPELSEAATLSRELQNFQVKITDAANDTYGAWREGTHDDLVLAIALAVWNANIAPFKVTERVRQIFKMIS